MEQTYRSRAKHAGPAHSEGHWARALSENNRRAIYYTLTKSGRKALDTEAAGWERLAAAISTIVRAV